MDDERAEQIDLLVTDFLDWLPTATQDDILTYAKRSGDRLRGLLADVRDELVTRLLVRRGRLFQDALLSNAAEVLPETRQIALMADLASYAPASVLANYRQAYPGLTATDAPPADLAAQAQAWLAAWSNGLHFLTAADYLDDSVLLDSLAKLGMGGAVLDEQAADARQLQADVDAELASHNYEVHAFPPALGDRIHAFLAQFQIFPEDSYLRPASTGLNTPLTLSALASVTLCLEVLGLAAEAGVPADRPDLREAILWNELANQLEVDALLGREVARRQRLRPATVPEDPLLVQLDALVTVPNLESGECQRQLRAYAAQLLPEQRKAFLARLETFLLESPVVQSLFDPVDAEYFISQIRSQSLSGTKQEFVASLESRVVPELWPVTQKLMLMIASFY